MRFLRKYLPSHQSIKKSSSLRWVQHWLVDPQLWHFNRRSVAMGMAVGLFSAIIPVPIQMLLATLLAILLRGNIPLAVMVTWVTNPFTMLPMIYLIYFTGTLLTGEHAVRSNFKEFTIDYQHLPELWSHFIQWLTSLGKNFFIGLPIVALSLAIIGYFSVHLVWRLYIYLHIFQRKGRQSRRNKSNT